MDWQATCNFAGAVFHAGFLSRASPSAHTRKTSRSFMGWARGQRGKCVLGFGSSNGQTLLLQWRAIFPLRHQAGCGRRRLPASRLQQLAGFAGGRSRCRYQLGERIRLLFRRPAILPVQHQARSGGYRPSAAHCRQLDWSHCRCCGRLHKLGQRQGIFFPRRTILALRHQERCRRSRLPAAHCRQVARPHP